MRKCMLVIGLTACALSSLMFFPGAGALGSTQSQALVEQGRARLFNNGKFTYSGIVAADEKFKEAVEKDETDEHALFFYAISRLSVSFLTEGSGVALDTFGDFFKSIGMPRNGNDFPGNGPPFRDIRHINDLPDFPETTPDGNQIKAFLSGPVMMLADHALSGLSGINAAFRVILTSLEIGSDHDIEIDYTDILLFRSFLQSLKSIILIIQAYDLDVDIRELAALINLEKYSDIFLIQRNLLDKYPDVLKLIPATGAQSLAGAKTAFMEGIKDFSGALERLQAETDDQSDDLFFFERPKELLEAREVASRFAEIYDALDENRAAAFTYTDEEWMFSDNSGNEIGLWVQKDKNNQFVSGEFWTRNDCRFIACDGDIVAWTVNGTTLYVELESDCGGISGGIKAILTGTLSGEGQHVTGTFNVTNSCGSGQSGTYTGVRQRTETETETMDCNRIFGNTGKAPLDIRSILPEFDPYNEPVAYTFPPANDSAPVLNGFFPDLQTNADAARAWDLAPSGYLTIPEAAISIDGLFNDWTGVSPVFVDFQGDDDPDFTGMDMEKLYLAEDDDFYYFRMTFYEDLGSAPDQTPVYGFIAKTLYEKGSWTVGDRACLVWPLDRTVRVVERSTQPTVIQRALYDAGSNYARAGQRSVEWKVPKQDMGNLTGKFVGTFARIQQSTLLSDIGATRIRLETASVSGTVTCASCNENQFYVSARGNFFSSPAVITTFDGAFTIEGLPVQTDIYLDSFRDADGNGIINNLDRIGGTGPFQIPEGGLTNADVAVDTPAWGESTLSGNVICSGFQPGMGKIYVLVLNGPDPNLDGLIQTKILEGPGPFTIEHLNFLETVWVYAYWDVDGAGSAGPDEYDYGASYAGNPVWLSLEEISLGDLSVKIPGDLDNSGIVDLTDAILGLKTGIGMYADVLNSDADVNQDGKIGPTETVYILQTVSGLK